MTCEEFERALPEQEDGGHTIEADSHLNSCSTCADLVSDLRAISEEARFLQDTDEPSPRVWNSIEIALRQEGLIRQPLIHQPKSFPFLVPRQPPRGRMAWLIPAVAALVLTAGLVYYGRSPVRPAQGSLQGTAVSPAPNSEVADASNLADQQLLEVVSRRTPAMLESYKANLRNVNSYIQDAEESAKTDPNDQQAQRYLMSAYEEKSMVYQMALDRSMP